MQTISFYHYKEDFQTMLSQLTSQSILKVYETCYCILLVKNREEFSIPSSIFVLALTVFLLLATR